VLVIEADVLFGAEALAHLLGAPESDATLVAPFEAHVSGSAVLCDEHGIVQDWLHASQQGADFALRTAFKTVNVTRLSRRTAAKLLKLCTRAGTDEPLEYPMRRLVLSHGARIHAVDVQGALWCEVDTPEDVRWAEESFGGGMSAGRG
jgi:choline kinase